jgi:hypothetical protein
VATTFDVYPGPRPIPSLTELLARSSEHLNEFLRGVGLDQSVHIEAYLHHLDPADLVMYEGEKDPRPADMVVPFDGDSALWPEEDHYMWFTVPPAIGGTDAHVSRVDRHIWDGEIAAEERGRMSEPRIRQCLEAGYWWWFRRSAGQPGIINLAYGLIAGSLAELTSGFIYTDDNAWDYALFPAEATDFLGWYFRPEFAVSHESRTWAERCIAGFEKDLVAGRR